MQDQVRTVRVVIDSSGAIAGARQYNGALDSMEARSRAASASNDNHAASTTRLIQQLTGATQANNGLGRSIDAVRGTTVAANDNFRSLGKSIDASGSSLKGMVEHIGTATLAIAGLGFAIGGIHALIHTFVELSDEATEVTSRLLAFTNSAGELADAQQKVVTVSEKTRSALPEIAELFQKIGIQADHLHLSMGGVETATTVFAETLKLSGSTTNQQKAAMLQLGEAFDIGQLNGRHFIAMMQDNIVFMRLLATSMGVPIGKLKEMSKEGKVTSDAIKKALTDPKMVAEIEKRFDALPVSFAQVRTAISNTLVQLAGDFSNGAGLNAGLRNMFNNITDMAETYKTTFENIGKSAAKAFEALRPAIQAIGVVSGTAFGLITQNLGLITSAALTAGTAMALFRAGMIVSEAVAFVGELIALEKALGAVSTAAALSGVGLKGLQSVMTLLTSSTVVLGGAATAAAAAIVYFATDAASSNATLHGLKASGLEAANGLFDLESRARAAGVNVNTLSNAAATGNPLLVQIAGSYGKAATEAQRLAINARQAAIAVAQGKVAELTAQRDTLNENDRKGVKNGNFFVGVRATVRDIMGEVGLGPTREQRIQGSNNLNNQIDIYNRQIKLLKTVPDSVITPPPPKGLEGGGEGDDKKKGPKDNTADQLKNYWQSLNDQLDLSQKFGIEAEKLTKEKELQSILDRQLTASEKDRVDTIIQQITNEKAITDLKKSTFDLNNKTAVAQARQLGLTDEQGKVQDALDAKTVAALNEGVDVKNKAFQTELANYKVALERSAAQEALNALMKEGLETVKKYAPAFAMDGELKAMQKELDDFLKAYATGNLKDVWGKPMSEITKNAVTQGIKDAMALKPLEGIANYTGEGSLAGQDVAILKAKQSHDAALALVAGNPALDPTTRDKYLKDIADKYKSEMDKATSIVADAAAAKLKKVFDDLGDVLTQIGSAIGGKAGAAVGAAGDATKAYGAFADSSKKTSDAITQAFDPNGKSPLIAGIGKAVGGAVAGLEIGDKIGQLSAALGLKGGETGAKIGGSIGGAAFGPIGSILGALGGGLISSLFYKPPSSSVGFTNDANGNVVAGDVSGSNAQLRKATTGAAGDVINGLASLASSLGGKLTGAPNLQIGTFDDKWRVNDSATSKSLNYNNFNDSTLHNFDDDEAAAVKYAIGKALTQGVITGLSDLAQKSIKALDQDSAVTLVQNWSAAMKDFASLTDPVTAAVQDITTPLQQLRDSMVSVGASTADLTKLDQYRAAKLAEVLKQQTSSIRGFLDDLKGDAGGVSKLSQLTTQMNLLKGFDADVLAGKTIDQDAFQNALTKATSLNGDIYGTNTSAFQDNVSQFSKFGNDLLTSITNAVNTAAGGDATTNAIKTQTDQVTATIGIGNDLQQQTNNKLDKVIDLLASGTLTIVGNKDGKQAVSY